MAESNEHEDLRRLLEETKALEEENNRLLKKLYRYSWVGFVMRLTWYALLIGLPFALYFYILEPYFGLFGSSYSEFREGVIELPGYKSLILFLDTVMGM